MRRRSLLAGAAAATMGPASRLRGAVHRDVPVVQSLELFTVKVNHRGDWLLVRCRSNDGQVGLGDASHGGPHGDQVRMIRELFALIQGRSIYDVEQLHAASAPYLKREPKLAAIAVSALEQTLWDMQGRFAGVPAYDLFGGALRKEIRLYANINRTVVDRSPEGFTAVAQRAVDDGFDAIKLAPFDGMPAPNGDSATLDRWTDLGVRCAEAVRAVIGPKRDLLIDVHSHMTRERGLMLAERLRPLQLFWLEEVAPAEPVTDLAAINEAAPMPTAGGESIFGVKGFYPYIAGHAVRIVMPDVKSCGGLLEMKKISGLAEGAGLQVSPHGPASPVGGFAAAHLSATLPNFLILEHAYGEVPWRSRIVAPNENIERGRLRLTDAPGFGIDWDEKELERHRA